LVARVRMVAFSGIDVLEVEAQVAITAGMAAFDALGPRDVPAAAVEPAHDSLLLLMPKAAAAGFGALA
jgi:hypothetical protein